MQILINIAATFAFMFWPMMFMMSPMMLGAPGADNDKDQLKTVILLLSYPIGISIFFWLFGIHYFGIDGFTLTIISSGIIAIALSIFGYFGMLLNLYRGIANSGYSVANHKVYYDAKLIKAADSDSFSIFDDDLLRSCSRYAKDKLHFYYNGKTVEGFGIDGIYQRKIGGDTYWFNQNQVLYDDRILIGANPDNFDSFDEYTEWTYSISKEQFSVFKYGKRLPAVDKESFIPLSSYLAKDSNHIFKTDEIILPDADAQSFELFEDHSFGKDKNHIYYLETKEPFAIQGVDPASFEILDRGYLKDINHVYRIIQYEDIEKLEQADVASFEATPYDEASQSEARDKNHYYYDGKIVGNRK